MSRNITHTARFDCASHDALGWAHHRIMEALDATPSDKLGADGQPLSVAQVIAQGRALLDAQGALPSDGSGRNPFRYAQGTGHAVVAECHAAGLDVSGVDPRHFWFEPVGPSRPVTLGAVVARRRAVRRARYADAQPVPVRLDGVAVASTGEQVLTDDALAWSERPADRTIRSGAYHGPVIRSDADGRQQYVTLDDLPAAKRARRKTPETAVKEIRRAIENVAASKRPESWARDRLHKYAELLDVDVYDGLVDALDDALAARLDAPADAAPFDGGTIQAERLGTY